MPIELTANDVAWLESYADEIIFYRDNQQLQRVRISFRRQRSPRTVEQSEVHGDTLPEATYLGRLEQHRLDHLPEPEEEKQEA
jgi:hypothetical protein